MLFVAMCAVPKKELTPEEKAAAEKQKIDGKIASGVREFKYDKKAYPKLYKQWGEKAVNEMNGYLPRIAEHIAREDSCDAVETVDISDSRSNPKAKQMVFFVDCRNGKRFLYLLTTLIPVGNQPLNRIKRLIVQPSSVSVMRQSKLN